MDSNNESQLESDSESIFDDESIDLDFIEEFDKTMKQYRDFYKENVETIKVKFLYVNKENRLEKIKHDDLILKTPNIITCGELIKILKSNNKVMNKYYKIPHSLKNSLLSDNKANYFSFGCPLWSLSRYKNLS